MGRSWALGGRICAPLGVEGMDMVSRPRDWEGRCLSGLCEWGSPRVLWMRVEDSASSS